MTLLRYKYNNFLYIIGKFNWTQIRLKSLILLRNVILT
jgi:hypothetical protein